MRQQNFVKLLALCMAITTVSKPAIAVTDYHAGYCDNIESTAEALKCITEHKKVTEAELNKAYQTLSSQLEKEDASNLSKIQSEWIEYRNNQCTWEASLSDPSLSRLHELSCIASLTQERHNRIYEKIKNMEKPLTASEFGSVPKYINALYEKYPQVIWDTKSRINYDLNCDEDDEYILHGVSVTKDTVAGAQQRVKTYVAIIDGIDNGRPKFDVLETNALCGTSPELEYRSGPLSEDANQQQASKRCKQMLTISSQFEDIEECPTWKITHEMGGGYSVELVSEEQALESTQDQATVENKKE